MPGQDGSRAKTTPAVMCVKILLQGFNALYLILGIAILAIGIWTKMELFQYVQLTGLYYSNAAYVMIGVGVLIMLVSLGGFYCTAKNKIPLLYIYAVFIGFVAVLQIAAGIAGGVFHEQINKKLLAGLESNLKQDKVTEWDFFQKKLKCCGIYGPADWDSRNLKVPESCNKPVGDSRKKREVTTLPSAPDLNLTTVEGTDTSTDANTTSNGTEATSSTALVTELNGTTTTTVQPTASTAQPITSPAPATQTATAKNQSSTTPTIGANTTPTTPMTTTGSDHSRYYPNGCYDQLTEKFKSYLSIIAGVAFGFVFIQIVGVILACCLAKKVGKNNYEQIY